MIKDIIYKRAQFIDGNGGKPNEIQVQAKTVETSN